MTATFPLAVSVFGTAMSQLQGSNFKASLVSSTGATIPVTAVTVTSSPAGSTAPGKFVTVKVSVAVKPSDLPASGLYHAVLNSMSSVQNGIVTTTALDGSAFSTGAYSFIK